MRTPVKIDPCPIIEAIIEVRFESDIPYDAIFGMFYKEIKDLFGDYQKLPIFKLPEEVRQNEPKFTYSPHYQFKKENYLLKFGPRVLTLINISEYSGWNNFSEIANDVFTRFTKIDEFKNFERLGVRYVNFFSENIYEISNLTIDFPKNTSKVGKYFKTEYVDNNHSVIIKAGNNSNLKHDEKVKKGSSLDIDVINKDLGDDFLDDFNTYINLAHSIEKDTFFKFLKEEYIKTLNPTYS